MKRLVERILGRPDGREEPAGEHAAAGQVRAGPLLPPGRRLYSVGDIHGRLDLLEELHGMILRDASGFAGSKGLVYLGDYIDRGAQSKQVLDLLSHDALPGFDSIFLLGNHEQAMLDFLQHPRAALAWLYYGGKATLMSYGVGLGRVVGDEDVGWLRDELDARLPDDHLEFLRACRLSYVEGSYCFVHAGIRPGVPLDEQAPEDLIWIREDFTHSTMNHDCIVVHGHTICDEVEFLPNRIGIDTGAFYSGLLTCLVLERSEQRLLQTGRQA